jgi:hypothetical protein
MRERNFIENKSAFSLFRLLLLKLSEKSLLENQLYRNAFNGELWERYEFDKIEHLRISGTGYRTYPYPETSELIEIALTSTIDEEIIGACRLLFSLELKGIEFREALVSRLENEHEDISKKRFGQIYDHANLMNQGNLRTVMNKTDKEITADLDYYHDLYFRALGVKKKKLMPTTADT